MTREDELQSPFVSGDALLFTAAGVLTDIAASAYADHILEKTLTAAAGLDEAFQPASAKAASYNSRVEDIVKNSMDGERGGRGYSKRKHRIRSFVKESELLSTEVNIPFKTNPVRINGHIASVEKKGGLLGMKKAIPSLLADPEVPSVLKDSLKAAAKARAFGVLALGLGAAQTGFEIGTSVLGMLARKGREMKSIGRAPQLGSDGFQDTRMAYTTRQHAMRAIQLSQGGLQRAHGNEASYLHTFR